MVCFSPSIEQGKHISYLQSLRFGCGVHYWVWCSYNERTNPLCVYRCLLTSHLHVYRCLLTSHLHVYRCLLTSHLHDKAAELCLANSRNNRVSATKYNSIHSAVPRHALLWVSFYCDVITKSCLQLINTLIDTFFSKLCAFLAEQRRRKAIDS